MLMGGLLVPALTCLDMPRHSAWTASLLLLLAACSAQSMYTKTMLDGIPWAWPANNNTNFASKRPKIYVYELPAKYRMDEKFQEAGRGNDYSLDIILPWMVKQSPYVTKNPAEADFFMGAANPRASEEASTC